MREIASGQQALLDISFSVQLMQRMLLFRKNMAYLLISKKQLGLFWEKEVHECYVTLNRASNKVT